MSGPRPVPDPAEIARRIWAKDASLWSDDPKVQAEIRNRLGWLDLPTRMRAEVPAIRAFAEEVRAEGFTQALVLGMGGSSLCVEVLARAIGPAPGWLDVRICDTTVPADILEATAWAERAKTLFIVSSKSGTTIETTSLYRHFRARVDDGARYVAITDPGSALEALAKAERFRKVFAHPADVGGRYAALSPVGLVPTAMMGIPAESLLDGAKAGVARCRRRPSRSEGNLGLDLGALLVGGRVLPILPSLLAEKVSESGVRALMALGPWAEQLVAESTGKNERGALPLLPDPKAMDRSEHAFDAPAGSNWAAHDLGEAIFALEFATAVAGVLLGVNPFDEPDVSSAKARTQRLLIGIGPTNSVSEPKTEIQYAGLRAWVAPVWPRKSRLVFASLLADLAVSDPTRPLVAILSFLPRQPRVAARLRALRRSIRKRHDLPHYLYWGPRYLHSTGQFFKGGTDACVFLMLTADDPVDVPIPGAPYSFGTLCRAQALGDYEALVERGRRVMRVHLGSDIPGGLAKLTEIVASA